MSALPQFVIEQLQLVADEYKIPTSHILGKRRFREVVRARHDLYWRLTQLGYSYHYIASMLNVDHTSVMYGASTHATRGVRHD